MTVVHALGVRSDDGRVPLSPMVASANREVLQSGVNIRQAIEAGTERTHAFCAEVADRVSRSGDADLSDVITVEIATSVFDTVLYFEVGSEPIDRRVHARCEVGRE
jgi:hypothetical protein